MGFSERLDLAMRKAGYTQGRLAKEVGMAQSSVNKLLNGANGSRRTVEIASVLRVRPEWLSTGDEPMHSSDLNNSLSSLSVNKSRDDIYRVDVLDISVSAGPGVINSEFIEVLRSVEYSVDDARHMFSGRRQDQIRIINVRGDSMAGTIEPGDLLFVDITVQQFDGDGIYAFIYDETAHVKRLQKMKDKLLVISDNRTYTQWDPIEKEEANRMLIFGKVIGSMPQTYRKHG